MNSANYYTAGLPKDDVSIDEASLWIRFSYVLQDIATIIHLEKGGDRVTLNDFKKYMASGTTPYNAKVRENMLKDCLTDFAKNYPYRCRTDPKVLDFCKHYLMCTKENNMRLVSGLDKERSRQNSVIPAIIEYNKKKWENIDRWKVLRDLDRKVNW